jgi:hypothetical protein
VPELDLRSSHTARRIGRCGQCRAVVPLRFAEFGESGTTWVCATCGNQFCAVLEHDSPPEARQNILLGPLPLNRFRLPPPPKVTAQFIAERVNREADEDVERRADPRRAIAAPVATIPLDPFFLPAGEPFTGMAHNISAGGIALIHTRSVATPYLALELTLDSATEMRVVIQVVRCQTVGLFYEIAGPFLVRIAPQAV